MYKQVDLIEEVRQRPTLWDAQYKRGTDKCLRDMDWLGVAKALFPNWAQLHPKDRRKNLLEIRRRWKNIRDYHKKESKKWTGKKYMYKDLLTFLDDQDMDNSSDMIVKDESTLDLTEIHDQEIIIGHEEHSYEGITVPKVQSPIKNQEDPQHEESDLSRKRKREDDDNIDEDKLFLLSLIPEMRKLSGRQKISFTISVLQSLKEARYSGNSTETTEEVIE